MRLFRGTTIVFAGLVMMPGLSGCQSSTPAADQMSRTTAQTAPADLQLLCANAAATQLNIDGNRILPVGSRKIDGENFVVDLRADGRPLSCTINESTANPTLSGI